MTADPTDSSTNDELACSIIGQGMFVIVKIRPVGLPARSVSVSKIYILLGSSCQTQKASPQRLLSGRGEWALCAVAGGSSHVSAQAVLELLCLTKDAAGFGACGMAVAVLLGK